MLKKEVNILENERRSDRSQSLWTQIKELKKKKLKLKDRLHATK